MAEDTQNIDPALSSAMSALVDIVKAADTTDAMQAQAIMLRRLALQGNVTGSRVPAPNNITEVGGYLNYLESLQQAEMRAQALAGILGVAGPNPPLGWQVEGPPLAFASVPNPRPEGPWQAAIPLAFHVRSDFQPALTKAVSDVSDMGGALPLLTPNPGLPPATPTPGLEDPMPSLGRTLDVVPATALRDPTTDPIVFARAAGSTNNWAVMARVLAPGSVPVVAADWEALQCDAVACTTVALPATALIAVEPLLAHAGFYRPVPLAVPANDHQPDWARFVNRTGLVNGATRLGDELSLLYGGNQIATSAFSDQLSAIWDGQQFA